MRGSATIMITATMTTRAMKNMVRSNDPGQLAAVGG
jgi:hypothetical protein